MKKNDQGTGFKTIRMAVDFDCWMNFIFDPPRQQTSYLTYPKVIVLHDCPDDIE
jgi:hypothetical protein